MPETLDFLSKIESPSGENMVIENIVSSYQAKIENIDSFFETTYLILNGFQEPLLDARQERDRISAQLRDILAKNEHLRKADFNQMMEGIFSIQLEREKEIRNLLNGYFTEQGEMINFLKNNLSKIKKSLAKGKETEVKESKELLTKFLTQQDKKKREVAFNLKEFQKEQKEMIQRLLELLAKGKELRIKDLKSMLMEFQSEHKKRLLQQEERRIEAQKRKEEVHDMLFEFKKKRKDSVKSWRTNSPKENPPVRKAEEANEDNSVSNEVNIDVVKEGLTK